MVICPDCGKDVTDAKFCSNCGALLPKAEEVVDEKVEDTVVEVPVEEESVEEVAETVDVEEPEAVAVDEPAVEEVAETVDVEEPEAVAVDEPAAEEIPEVIVVDEVNTSAEKESDVNIVKKSKFCTNCGREVDLETAFCPNCGFKLNQEEKPQTKFCQNCGKKIDVNAEICPHCGVRVANFSSSEEKSVLLAAILSFLFPGLGQLYLGLSKKGVSFIIAYIISAVLIFILIGFVLMIIVWIWSLIDTIKSTEAINRGEFVEDKLF